MKNLQDKETNMNLLTTNEPINRIVQQDRFREFAISIPNVLEDGTNFAINLITMNSILWKQDHKKC